MTKTIYYSIITQSHLQAKNSLSLHAIPVSWLYFF